MLGNVQKSIMEKQGQLDELQRGVITVLSKGQSTVLARAIDKLPEEDELYWCQSSRRGKHNLITALEDEEGVWHRDMEGIHKIAIEFYSRLFTSQTGRNLFAVGQLNTNQLEIKAQTQMEKDFTREDIKHCLFSMNGTKAPGPDRMSAKFFQHYWPTVGGALCDMVLNFLNNGQFLRKFTFTLITLVPKLKRPVNMTQFRLIAVYNTAAKVIAKVLAIRLKKYLPSVISDTQCAFLQHRLITDNILLAYEAHNVIKQRKSGPRCYMSIKLFMLKAYDRIEWAFLRAMLIQLGFSAKWISMIMTYVESITYSLLVNGEQVGYIKPGRGLRQRDPLSLYIFIICTESLISLLNEARRRGVLNGLELGTNLNPLTHLMFADDMLLLGEANIEEATIFRRILNEYELWSGQKVSTHKSTILFSPNMEGDTRAAISSILGMPVVESHSKYPPILALPRMVAGFEHLKVADLIDSKVGVWDIIKIHSLFYPVVSDAILQMPLNRLNSEDMAVWICNNKLTTTKNLSKRGVQVDRLCKLCNHGEKDSIHVLYHCKFIQEVSKLLKIKSVSSRLLDFRDIFEENWNRLPSMQFQQWMICLWDTWHQRNQVIREKQYRSPGKVVKFGCDYLAAQTSAPEDLRNLQPN
ncbi:hypothetical protein LIER_07147 [Lithospermum erythrorhizon]|uniref:Reverse transcriptase domain-containing protein n=1 Tax=Lithospermum erythrorhizon TaxID=34254 RepID=A0AAV3PAX5_LITER